MGTNQSHPSTIYYLIDRLQARLKLKFYPLQKYLFTYANKPAINLTLNLTLPIVPNLVTISKANSNWANAHSSNVERCFLITKDELQMYRRSDIFSEGAGWRPLCSTLMRAGGGLFPLSNRSGLVVDNTLDQGSSNHRARALIAFQPICTHQLFSIISSPSLIDGVNQINCCS